MPAQRWSLNHGAFVVLPDSLEIEGKGETRRLPPMVMAVLLYLVEHRDRVVDHEEIIAAVWGNAVDRGRTGLPNNVYQLRRLFDDNSDEPVYIRTIPKKGYRWIAAADPLIEATPASAEPAQAAGPRHAGPAWLRPGLLLGLLGLLGWLLWPRGSLPPRIAGELELVWGGAGVERHPVVSGDGRRLVFSGRAPAATGFDLFLLELDRPDAVPQALTATPEHEEHAARWSPDDRSLAFARTRLADRHCEVVLFDVRYRRARVVGTCQFPWTSVAWSPDGSGLVYTGEVEGRRPAILRYRPASDRTDTDYVFPPGSWGPEHFVWSQDGASLYFSRIHDGENDGLIERLEAGGRRQVLLADVADVNGLVLSPDGQGLLFGSAVESSHLLWYFDLSTRRRSAIPLASPDLSDPHLHAAGGQLYFSRRRVHGDILRIALDGSAAERPLLRSGDLNAQADMAFDHALLAFASDRSQSFQVWLQAIDSGVARQVSEGLPQAGNPALSPDGRWIAFTAACAPGNVAWQICLRRTNGGPIRLLSPTHLEWGVPSWTLDSRHVLASPDQQEEYAVRAFAVDEAQPAATWLPVGSAFARQVDSQRFVYYSVNSRGLHLFDRRQGDDRPLDQVAISRDDHSGFDVANGQLYYVWRGPVHDEVRRLDLESLDQQTVATVDKGRIGPGNLRIAPDGSQLITTSYEAHADLLRVAWR